MLKRIIKHYQGKAEERRQRKKEQLIKDLETRLKEYKKHQKIE